MAVNKGIFTADVFVGVFTIVFFFCVFIDVAICAIFLVRAHCADSSARKTVSVRTACRGQRTDKRKKRQDKGPRIPPARVPAPNPSSATESVAQAVTFPAHTNVASTPSADSAATVPATAPGPAENVIAVYVFSLPATATTAITTSPSQPAATAAATTTTATATAILFYGS